MTLLQTKETGESTWRHKTVIGGLENIKNNESRKEKKERYFRGEGEKKKNDNKTSEREKLKS